MELPSIETDGRSEDTARLASSVAILDDALDRVSALDFEIPNPFVNHAPMACEALAALGLDSLIEHWVEQFEISMHKAVQPVTPNWYGDFGWKDLFGDYRLLPEWTGYFERAIDEEGWRVVVEEWVPRLMPGLAAALFHGVIRTSHAVRAIEVADTRARRAELARALGNWAVWFSSGEPTGESSEFEDPGLAVLRAAAVGAGSYVSEPNIFNLHGITGAMAVHLLSGHLSPADARAAVAQLRAEHRSLYRDVVSEASGGETCWDEAIVVVASSSYDSHQIKLVEACLRAFQITADAAFLLAAEVVTSGDYSGQMRSVGP
jgi:hypothetical protein